MKRLFTITVVAAIAVVALKLFTYEFALQDDPGCGIAMRLMPSLVSRQPLRAGDVVLLQDESDYVGSRLYEATVNWGWVLLAGVPVVWWGVRRVNG